MLFIHENECVLLLSEEEPVEEDEAEQQSFQPTAKVGAKKQRKLEEKQAKKAQREVRHAPLSTQDWFLMNSVLLQCLQSHFTVYYFQAEMEEREERRRMQELREQERQQAEEKERLLEQKQVSPSLLGSFPRVLT